MQSPIDIVLWFVIHVAEVFIAIDAVLIAILALLYLRDWIADRRRYTITARGYRQLAEPHITDVIDLNARRSIR